MQDKIYIISFNHGFIETSSLSKFFFFHEDGFDTVYDAVSNLTKVFLQYYKEKTNNKFYCFRENNKKCPTKHPGYPHDYCHDCGRKTPGKDPTIEDIERFFEEEMSSGTMETFSLYETVTDCEWDEWIDLDQIMLAKHENIAYFNERPIKLFMLTSTGEEFGKSWKKEIKDLKKNHKIGVFWHEDLDLNKIENFATMIDLFEDYRLSEDCHLTKLDD